MSTTTPLVDAAVNDTAFEDKSQPHTDWITAYAAREIEEKLNKSHAREAQLRVALSDASSAISTRIEGKLVHAYLRQQFPATDGHIPLNEYFKTLGSAIANIAGAITLPAPPVVPADQHEKLINDFSTACEIIALVKRAVSDLPPHIEDCIDSFAEERELKFPEAVPAEELKPLVTAIKNYRDDCPAPYDETNDFYRSGITLDRELRKLEARLKS